MEAAAVVRVIINDGLREPQLQFRDRVVGFAKQVQKSQLGMEFELVVVVPGRRIELYLFPSPLPGKTLRLRQHKNS